MKISRELDKFLNERVRKLLIEDKIPTTKVVVGWSFDNNCVWWAEKKKKRNKWVLRSGPCKPKNCATPKELLNVEGAYEISLSDIIPAKVTVLSCM